MAFFSKNRNVKTNKIWLTIIGVILSAASLVAGAVLLAIGLVSKFNVDSEKLNIIAALIGFLGAVGGVALPLTISRLKDKLDKKIELNSLLQTVFGEFANYYFNLNLYDTFIFETPSWNSFETNFIHYSSINEEISNTICEVYTNINYLNDLFKKYNSLGSTNEPEKMNLFLKISKVKNYLLDVIAKLLNINIYYIAPNFSKRVLLSSFVNLGTKQDEKLKEILDLEISKYKFDYFFNEEIEGIFKTISPIDVGFYNPLFKNICSKVTSRKKILSSKLMQCKQNSCCCLFYFIPNDFTDFKISKYNFDSINNNLYDDYVSFIPNLLINQMISPALLNFKILVRDFEPIVTILKRNITNENYVTYLIMCLFKYNSFEQFLNFYFSINSTTGWDVALFTNYVINFVTNKKKKWGREESELFKKLSQLKIDNLEDNSLYSFYFKMVMDAYANKCFKLFTPDEEKTFNLFLTKLNNDHLFLNEQINDLFGSALYMSYMQLICMKNFAKSGITKERNIEVLYNLKDLCEKNIGELKQIISKDNIILRANINYNLYFLFVNYYLKILSSILEIDEKGNIKEITKLLFDTANSSCIYANTIKENDVWNFNNYHQILLSIETLYFLITNDAQGKYANNLLISFLNKFSSIIMNNKGTVLESIYVTLSLNFYYYAFLGINKSSENQKNHNFIDSTFNELNENYYNFIVENYLLINSNRNRHNEMSDLFSNCENVGIELSLKFK